MKHATYFIEAYQCANKLYATNSAPRLSVYMKETLKETAALDTVRTVAIFKIFPNKKGLRKQP